MPLSQDVIDLLNKSSWASHKAKLGDRLKEAFDEVAANTAADTVAKNEDASWGNQLADAVEGLASKADLAVVLAAMPNAPTSADIAALVLAIAQCATKDDVAAVIQQLQQALGPCDSMVQAVNALSSACEAKAAKADEVETADATDLASALTLINELKAKLNAMNA